MLNALLALLALGLGPQQARQPSAWVLVDRFVHADSASKWKPDKAEVTLAAAMKRKRRGVSYMRLAASSYCLALAGVDRARNVREMSICAQKAWPGLSEYSDGRSALPDALDVIFSRTHSPAALMEIARLELDGAPGEMMAATQAHAFHLARRDLASVWAKLPRRQQTFLVDGLALELGSDISLAERRRGIRSGDYHLKQLCRRVEKSHRADERRWGGL